MSLCFFVHETAALHNLTQTPGLKGTSGTYDLFLEVPRRHLAQKNGCAFSGPAEDAITRYKTIRK